MTKYKLCQELLVINEEIEIPDGAVGITVNLRNNENLNDCYCTTITYLKPVHTKTKKIQKSMPARYIRNGEPPDE